MSDFENASAATMTDEEMENLETMAASMAKFISSGVLKLEPGLRKTVMGMVTNGDCTLQLTVDTPPGHIALALVNKHDGETIPLFGIEADIPTIN